MLLFLIVMLATVYAQLYPTLTQQRPIYLPAHLHQNLQVESPEGFAGTVPVYEPVYQSPHTMMASSSVPVSTLSTPPIIMQPMPQSFGPSQYIQAMPLPAQQAFPYGYGYAAQQKSDGPLKRFLRGAADGFMLGTMGWLG